MHAHTHTCDTCACILENMLTCMSTLYLPQPPPLTHFLPTSALLAMHMYEHIYMYIYISIYTYIYIYIYICICMYIYIYISIYIYTYIYVYIYVYIHIRMCLNVYEHTCTNAYPTTHLYTCLVHTHIKNTHAFIQTIHAYI